MLRTCISAYSRCQGGLCYIQFVVDWYKLRALIVGLGVDPHEGLASVFPQRILCLTTRSQYLCHRGMRDHRSPEPVNNFETLPVYI